MATVHASKSLLSFGVFEFDPATGELRKHGLLLKLHPQPAKVLILLTSRPHELVTREKLKETLWGQETFVDFEQGLNSCVRQIRTVLSDDPDSPRFIETVPRQGYRFIAPVISRNGSAGLAGTVAPPAKARLVLRPTWLSAIALLVAASLIAIYFSQRRTPVPAPPKIAKGKIMLAVLPFANYSQDSEREYLADGLTEEMIAQLGSLEPAARSNCTHVGHEV